MIWTVEQSSSCHSHSIVSPILNKTTCQENKNLFPTHSSKYNLFKHTHTTLEPFCLILIPFFILNQWQSKKGGTNKAKITQDMKLLQQHNKKWWSVRSITSIVVSRLLIMLKSSLTKNFQLHNGIFHEQPRGWHCGGKDELSEAAVSVSWGTFSFSSSSFSFRASWTLWGILLGMELEWWLFSARPRDEEESWDGIFYSKSEWVGKKRCLTPYTKLPWSPISVLHWWGFL